MKQIIFSAILILSFCLVMFAQENDTKFENKNKIATINSDAFFDEKTGIKGFAEELQKLDFLQKVQREGLDIISRKRQSLKKEIQSLPCSNQVVEWKLIELENLQREYDFRSEKVDSLFSKRKQELIRAFKVRGALIDFKEQRGFAIIIDKSTLNTSLIIKGNEDFPNVTSEFIRFYNSKYAGTIVQ